MDRKPTQSLLKRVFGYHIDRAALAHHFLYETPSMLGLYSNLDFEEVLALSHSWRLRADRDPGLTSLLSKRDVHELFSYIFRHTPPNSLTFENIRGAIHRSNPPLSQTGSALWARLNPFQETKRDFSERLARCDSAHVQKAFEELGKPTKTYVAPGEYAVRVYKYGKSREGLVLLPYLSFSKSGQIAGYIKDIIELICPEIKKTKSE